jgi:hypothetical protein
MRRHVYSALLVLVGMISFSPTRAKAEELTLELAGTVAAFQEMIAYELSWNSAVQTKDFCIGLEVSFEPTNTPKLADLPAFALETVEKSSDGRANLHQASQCTVFRNGFALFKGRPATLLTYWNIDMEIAETLRSRGSHVPEQPVRLSFEPNRLVPMPVDSAFATYIRPDGRMKWDGFGSVGDSCGPRYYDFAGDARNVQILRVMQHPQIC